MTTRFVHRILLFALFLLSASTVLYAQDELCTDGILLFREDFGGNDTSDPAVGHTPVSGMTSGYQQVYTLQTSDPGTGMGAGRYLVAKRGYRNSSISTYSVWHIMDDHTHFGDTTRGYLLEIDGLGSGNDVFYSTVIDGLCAGSRLTFSAYVANLTTAGQYNGWRNRNYVHPKLSFVITHPVTGAELARYNTDTISHDWSNYPKSWRETADWQLVGMNFTVPEGIDSVRLSIRNNASGSSTGNDFALDDIEIRLCLTPDTILTDTTVCDTTQHIRWRERLYQIADTLRDTIRNSCGLDSVYYLLNVQTEHCDPPEPTLCTSGILLFREDFGGNKPSDPRVSSTSVPGMTYRQSTGAMGSGVYMVTKSGYCNGDTTGWSMPGADRATKRSQWYIQDDHTYPNDYTRGYFMEIDGKGGNQQFYETEISGLCEGIELTFSAYVANVFTWFQYDWYTRNRGPVIAPCLKFVLTNPQTGETLAEKNTQEIPFDEALPALTDWQYSSAWHLVGMNFTVPVGVNAIRLSIYNNVTNGNGNDFAIDDIEVHLCMTPDTIRTDTTVCDTTRQIRWREKTFAIADTLRDTLFSTCGFDSIYYVMHVEKENCEHALCTDGILLFREDFGGNDPNDPKVGLIPMTGIASLYRQDTQYAEELYDGHYLIAKEGSSNKHFWHIMDDHTYPNDKTRGYFFETNSVCGTGRVLYVFQKELIGVCAGMELSFSAYVANLVTARQFKQLHSSQYSYPYLNFLVNNARTGELLARYWTDTIGHDWSLYNTPDSWQYSAQWQLKGMKFTIPDGVDKIQLTIINTYSSPYSYTKGNDFAIDDIEVHLCSNAEYQIFDTIVCDTTLPFTWHGIEWVQADTIGRLFKDVTGEDSVYVVCSLNTFHCPYPPVSITKDTTICDTLLQVTLHDTTYPYAPTVQYTLLDAYGYDSVYYTWNINTYHCPYPPITVVSDTLVCDTIDVVAWHGKNTELSVLIRDTLFDTYGFDSVYYVLNISLEHCCPDIQTITLDTTVCDTLLPFTWIIDERTFVFEQAETQEISISHSKWENCIGKIYTLSLDTIHCERLYPLIVNKYNWQLLLDNVTLRTLFPDRTARSYQWYKDDLPIPGATEDDYSEQNELHGRFQLRIELDNNQTIWSNILEINVQRPTTNDQLQVHIFNCHGQPVREDQLTRGIYLYRYQQGDTVWTEKRLIP